MRKECEECNRELMIDPVNDPNVDWLRVVCSNCGTVNDVSMIRFSQEVRSE